MTVVRLLVLGVVRLRHQAHGYAIQRELRSWNVEAWASVKPGSIYHALKQLTKEDKLHAVGQEESGQGPERTLYELTAAGLAEFHVRLDAALQSPQRDELAAGVAFMHTLPRQRVVDLLRAQQRQTERIMADLARLLPGFPNRDEPPHTQDLLELWHAGYAARATWLASLLARLEAGAYTMADDPIPPVYPPAPPAIPI
jgi:DNA-binding PadR family transcriptional regulator